MKNFFKNLFGFNNVEVKPANDEVKHFENSLAKMRERQRQINAELEEQGKRLSQLGVI